MPTESYEQQHEYLRKLISVEIEADRAQIETDERLDLEEETEDELGLNISPIKYKKRSSFRFPTDYTVVTWNRNGSPRSYFRYPQWTLCDGSDEETIKFGSVHKEFGLDLSSKLCMPLVRLHKLYTFFHLPGNDPTKMIRTVNTAKGKFYEFLHPCSLLKEHGYLYGKDGHFIGLSTFSVDTLRAELLASIERDDHTRVARLASSFTSWINISQLAEFPPEYSAPFTANQLWADGLNKRVITYLASKKTPWDVIEFDDLVQMFETSTTSIGTAFPLPSPSMVGF